MKVGFDIPLELELENEEETSEVVVSIDVEVLRFGIGPYEFHGTRCYDYGIAYVSDWEGISVSIEEKSFDYNDLELPISTLLLDEEIENYIEDGYLDEELDAIEWDID